MKFSVMKDSDTCITIIDDNKKSYSINFVENKDAFEKFKDDFDDIKIDFPCIIIGKRFGLKTLVELSEINIIMSFISYCLSGIDVMPETIIDHKDSFNNFCNKRYGSTDSEYIFNQMMNLLNIQDCVNNELFKAYKTGAQDMYDKCINIVSGFFLLNKSNDNVDI